MAPSPLRLKGSHQTLPQIPPSSHASSHPTLQERSLAKGEAELDAELRDRFIFQQHDFFTPNPVNQPDIFLLRLILHDWPDEDAVAILRQLVPKMGPRTRLLINDAVLPPPGTMHPLQEKYLRKVDMMMMSMFNSVESSLEDWEEVIAKGGWRIDDCQGGEAEKERDNHD